MRQTDTNQTLIFRRIFFAALLSMGVGCGACAQSSATAAVAAPVADGSHLVNIPVIVYDKKGELVDNLTQDSFVLQVDNHAQSLHGFGRESELPLTLGLLVDVGAGQRDALDEERTASSAFLDQTLTGSSDKNKAFIIQFARQTDLLQDTTSSKPKLLAGLKQLETSASGGQSDTNGGSGSNSGGGSGSGNGTGTSSDGRNGRGGDGNGRSRRNGTTLYDALFLSSDELMSKQSGRKVIVLLSDGVDGGSKESLASAIEAAQRADTIVYAIYSKGREQPGYQNRENQGGGQQGGHGGGGIPGIGLPGGGGRGGGQGGGPGREPEIRPDGRKILQRMVDETGGRLFEVSKRQPFAEIYKQIGDELRAQYRLSYAPDKDSASDGYHRIVLSLGKSSPKDLSIQIRDGYYGKD